jgi:AraC-like DNA-binding protein
MHAARRGSRRIARRSASAGLVTVGAAFSRAFKRVVGMSPGAARRSGRGAGCAG